MYADQVVAGAKRSIKDRLDGNVEDDFSRRRSTTSGKRQRQDDDKWKHDLFEDNGPRVGANDLRLKLRKKEAKLSYQGLKPSTVRDLREKLNGVMHSQPSSNDPPKPKPAKLAQAQVSAKTVKKGTAAQAPAVETKRPTNPASSKKKSQHKDDSTVQDLLQSLGLEKYSITFQAEEVDMTALMHMNDDDLKALGIPMGPRKKIITALESRSLII